MVTAQSSSKACPLRCMHEWSEFFIILQIKLKKIQIKIYLRRQRLNTSESKCVTHHLLGDAGGWGDLEPGPVNQFAPICTPKRVVYKVTFVSMPQENATHVALPA